jgi:cell division protein FtsI/penicillin-binding protein 2
VLALAVIAFAIGAVVGSGHGRSTEKTLADEFTAAWVKHDYGAMYRDIDRSARHAIQPSQFAALYQRALRTATATQLTVAGKAREAGGEVIYVPVTVHTRLFGTLHERFQLHFRESADGAPPRIVWTRSLEFPGLRKGELLSRRTSLPPRAALLSRDGSTLASGTATAAGERASPLGAAASAVVGSVGPIPSEELQQLEAEGVPPDAIVGVDGLERTFDAQLRGTPGGTLLAGTRVIASAKARPGRPVRTTISASLQEAAVIALGDHYGGVVVLQPGTQQILAVAGIGLDGLQPPGSTFKMVTLTGVLQYKVATPTTSFPYKTYALLDGVKLEDSESESCGGSLALSFAVSCNSVFAPLGVKLGAPHLVSTAERYGFNHSPAIPGAEESTIPPGDDIQGELELGSTAIGQGRVQATPLQMASVAATIGAGGVRHRPTFELGPRTQGQRVTSPALAHQIRSMMIDVVTEGTGGSAAVPGVVVAGKTGTAEIGEPSASCSIETESPEVSEGGEAPESGGCGESGSSNNPEDTDAWFAAFAPATKPKLAVCVMLVKDGFGGDTAAPVAKEILEAGLTG